MRFDSFHVGADDSLIRSSLDVSRVETCMVLLVIYGLGLSFYCIIVDRFGSFWVWFRLHILYSLQCPIVVVHVLILPSPSLFPIYYLILSIFFLS